MLNVIDEFTRECLAIRVARKLKAIDVIDVLSDLFILRGVPGHIRSDNGPEFVATSNHLHYARGHLGCRAFFFLAMGMARSTEPNPSS